MILTRHFAVIMALALAVVASADAEEKLPTVSSGEQLGQLMTDYYQAPRPDLIASAIAYLEKGGYPHNQQESQPLIGFFSEVFAGNPSMRNKWKAAVAQTTGPTNRMLDVAFRNAKDLSTLTKFD